MDEVISKALCKYENLIVSVFDLINLALSKTYFMKNSESIIYFVFTVKSLPSCLYIS